MFLADITPKNRRKGWSGPPIRRTSDREAIRLRGVAQTMKPSASTTTRKGMNARNRSAPGMRSMPSHR